MFDYTSRYASLDTATVETKDGRTSAYKRRRFLPSGEEMQLLVEVTVTECKGCHYQNACKEWFEKGDSQ